MSSFYNYERYLKLLLCRTPSHLTHSHPSSTSLTELLDKNKIVKSSRLVFLPLNLKKKKHFIDMLCSSFFLHLPF